MKVSIIVPAFNAERFIGRCLKSIISQTYSNIEVLVVDDGSTDNTAKEVKQFSEKDDRIILIEKANTGAYATRRIGEDRASGATIMHVDADDFLEPEAVELLIKKLESTGADVIIGNYHKIINGRKHLVSNNLKQKTGKKNLMKGILDNEITGYLCGKLFKKDLLSKITKTEKPFLFEDLYAVIQVFARNELYVEAVETPIYNYDIHGNNSTSTKNIKLIESVFELNEITQEILEKEGLLPALKNEFSAFKCRNWIVYSRLGGSRSYDRNYRKQFLKENYRKYARKNLVSYQKLEMLIYNQNPEIGHFITRFLKGVQKVIS
ncbi:glycosyltransferase [Gramella lutea]|uniref:Glycosyltransferase n=1 Tax=Christiangramia lutea TaxID=1607951 RepID=A0A9X1V213_9FLAO|nr:glycosyltransferase family 2 protein [Christiangramia lutea]MCH4822768.1 glycosyltransferase [Christiangramia lutea]